MTTAELFDTTPRVHKRLNVLPPNPEPDAKGRFPSWLHRPLPKGGNLWETQKSVTSGRLHTVCEEARCPNRLECWSKHTATFLALGKECTRACGFCSIQHNKAPAALDPEEPERIAQSVVELQLKHVVVTMVARDDLPDGGAEQMAKIVAAIRARSSATVELLTTDFAGNQEAWEIIAEAKPEVLNYNVETVRRLTPRVRHKATYERTLAFLRFGKERFPFTKSGMMLGLGEEREEVEETICDLQNAGCTILTMGQYLQPSPRHLRVKRFVRPEEFDAFASYGKEMGVPHMYCGPFVRSSYNAGEVFRSCKR